jgi:AbrB family looped-hinge helix DNA binding protein
MKEPLDSKVFGSVTVGQRGQIVIPVEIRKLLNIESGDKLIVFAKPEGKVVGLIPTEDLNYFLDSALNSIPISKT